MAYYDALIAKWPSVTGAATQAKLDALNALTVAGPDMPVSIATLSALLKSLGVWMAIKASPNPAAQAAVDLNSDLRIETIDMNLPIVVSMLAALVTAGLLTQAQSDQIVALKSTSVLWCAANGYPVNGNKGNLSLPDCLNAGLT